MLFGGGLGGCEALETGSLEKESRRVVRFKDGGGCAGGLLQHHLRLREISPHLENFLDVSPERGTAANIEE